MRCLMKPQDVLSKFVVFLGTNMNNSWKRASLFAPLLLVAGCKISGEPVYTQLYCLSEPLREDVFLKNLGKEFNALDLDTKVVVGGGEYMRVAKQKLFGVYIENELAISLSNGNLGDEEVMVSYLNEAGYESRGQVHGAIIDRLGGTLFYEGERNGAWENFCK